MSLLLSLYYYIFFALYPFLNNFVQLFSSIPFGVEMDDGKRRALIHKQVAEYVKKRQDGDMSPAKRTVQIKPFLKWKPTEKGNCPSKKPKELVVTTVGKKPVAV